MLLPRTCLSAVALAAFLHSDIAMTAAVPVVVNRAMGGFALGDLYYAVKKYLAPKNAYDPDVPNKCRLTFGTFDDAKCRMNVQCEETNKLGVEYPADQVCYLGGRQYFSDPHLGDFSITYTKAGGVNGDTTDGLHSPVLQFANIGNWENLDVDAVLAQQEADKQPGKLCDISGDFAAGFGGHQLGWQCGIPVIGQALFGISNYKPVTASSYKPGWCTMPVRQWQRNEDGVGADYDFDVLIYDDAKTPIGQVVNAPIDSVTKTLSVTSLLPLTVVVTAKGADPDPVAFAYGDQSWDSKDGSHQSNFGSGPKAGYEEGVREGDMGFTCT